MCKYESSIADFLFYIDDNQKRTDVEQHLTECADCQQQYRSLLATVAPFYEEVPAYQAPKQLKRSVMGEVRKQEALFAQASSDSGKTKHRRLAWIAASSAALASVAAIVFVAFALTGTSAPSSQKIYAQMSPGYQFSAYVETDNDKRILEVANMPAPGVGRVYQVWLSYNGQAPQPTDTLFVPRHGKSAVVLPKEAAGAVALVTSEPEGGSDTPTRKPLFSVSL